MSKGAVKGGQDQKIGERRAKDWRKRKTRPRVGDYSRLILTTVVRVRHLRHSETLWSYLEGCVIRRRQRIERGPDCPFRGKSSRFDAKKGMRAPGDRVTHAGGTNQSK